MKTRLINLIGLAIAILLHLNPGCVNAQGPGFWGMTNGGGAGDAGVIFKMNPDGTGYTTVRDFTYTTPGTIGDELGMQLWQSPSGKLYGIASGGGTNGWGVLFEYDPSNGAYEVKHNFLPATGSYPANSLVAGANGKLYGMTAQGGSSSKGVLYEFDYTTGTYTKKIDFTGTNGATPSGGNLYLHTNGKLYGFTSFGGANNFGVLFEYDPATNTLVKKIDFAGANGKFPYSSLVKANNNKLYSVTLQGGTVDLGILLEYDPATNTLTKRVDFSSSIGTYPASTMVLADNGNLYGTTSAGGASAGGVIFEFNPTTNVYTKKIDATSSNGNAAIGSLAKATNGKLYGLMYSGGLNGYGVIYEYDPASNTYTKKFDFIFDQSINFSPTGYAPRSTLVQASDGFLYGTNSFGGAGGRGTLFRFNPTNSAFSKRIDFNNAPNGKYPYSGLTLATNGKLYGVTNSGGVENEGTIFEIDPVTSVFSKRQDFTRPLGSYPQGSLVKAPNGKLYGLTTTGGANGVGTIFEFDPASLNTYVNKYDFESGTSGERPGGSLIVATNNKLYGMTSQGGANGAGTIFEYDPATNVFTKKADFNENTTGYGTVGELTQASNGKFYGLNAYGGLNGNGFGVLFEFDLATGTLTPRVSFNGPNGQEPLGSLIQAPNGKLYGVTGYGGANNLGNLFEYDPATNVFTNKIDFNGIARGSAPRGGLGLSPNGKLYGGSPYGGTNDKGVLFEYDPTTNTLTKKLDFNGTNGGGFLYGRLLFVKGAQTITFNSLTNKSANDAPFNLTASSSASLPITYTSSNSSVATISGSTVTIVGAGTTTITASQAGDAFYNPAVNVTQTLVVNKINQTITFGALTARNFNDADFTLSASSTSGLSVTYSSSNPAVATVTGNTVIIVGAGTTNITASQAGNATYNAAVDVTQSLTINKINQAISFTAIPDKTVGDPIFALNATSNSSLPISFSTTSSKITIANAQVTIVSAGRVTITAAQAGNSNYNAATSVDKSFCIKPAKPTITVTNVNTTSPTLTSSASNGNQWYRNGVAIAGATNSTYNATQAGIYKVQVQADDCISEFSNDQALIITGDIDNTSDFFLGVYPNPVQKQLTVKLGKLNERKEVILYDLAGKKMAQQNVWQDEAHFDVSDYGKGFYLVKVKYGVSEKTIRFVKE